MAGRCAHPQYSGVPRVPPLWATLWRPLLSSAGQAGHVAAMTVAEAAKIQITMEANMVFMMVDGKCNVIV